MRYLSVLILIVLVLMTAGCATKKPDVTPIPTTVIAPTPTPEPTVTRPLPGVDPIIGAWDNGMVFNKDGTVGSDPLVTWRKNEMVEYSYFVTTASGAIDDKAAGRKVDPTAMSREWIYNPNSDTIHIRGTTDSARRTLYPVPVSPVPSPA